MNAKLSQRFCTCQLAAPRLDRLHLRSRFVSRSCRISLSVPSPCLLAGSGDVLRRMQVGEGVRGSRRVVSSGRLGCYRQRNIPSVRRRTTASDCVDGQWSTGRRFVNFLIADKHEVGSLEAICSSFEECWAHRLHRPWSRDGVRLEKLEECNVNE